MTLGDYRKIAILLSGNEHSKAVKFFDDKIAKDGADAEVLADETQMIMLIGTLMVAEDHDTCE